MKQSKIRGDTDFGEKSDGALVHGIHKSIFSGLLSNLAMYDPEDKIYRATRNRGVTIFPGSVLAQKKKRPNWIIAQEIVETSRVWARAVGPVDPRWTEEFVPHLLKRNYGIPYYDIERGTVLAEEKLLFSGLLVSQGRKRFYGSVNMAVAKEIFIRRALVEGEARDKLKFVAKNIELYDSLLEEEAKIRSTGFLKSEEEIYEIYNSKLPSIASVKEAIGYLKKHGAKDLTLSKDDFIKSEIPSKTSSYPSKFRVGEKSFELNYNYNPGDDTDGITVKVPLSEMAFIHSSTFEWLVEPLWEEKIVWLLKSLPKSERKQFVPVVESAKKIIENMKFQPISFNEALSLAIKATYGKNISPKSFSEDKLPDHLKMRISVIGRGGDVIKSARDLDSLNDITTNNNDSKNSDISKIIKRNERAGIESWSFGDLPLQKELSKSNDGFSLYGFTALVKSGNSLKITYLTNREKAVAAHRKGVGKLLLKLLVIDLDWLYKDLKFSKELKLLSAPYGGEEIIKKRVYEIINDEIASISCNPPYKESEFNSLLKEKREILKGIGYRSLEILKSVFITQVENRDSIKRFSKKSSRNSIITLGTELNEEIEIYMEQFISGIFPYSLFIRFPKIVEALSIRIEKAFNSPAKYRESSEKLLYFQEQFIELMDRWNRVNCSQQESITNYQLMVEEFAISIFAQPKIKPLFKVSEKILITIVDEIKEITA
jgi:ATP-dependent helicase HrpA